MDCQGIDVGLGWLTLGLTEAIGSGVYRLIMTSSSDHFHRLVLPQP